MTITRTPKPKRLEVLLKLKALLEQISTASGYNFDLAGKVHLNRLLFGQDVTGNPPALSIVEAPRTDPGIYGGEGREARSDSWPIFIQGILPDTKLEANEGDIYFFVQDVERKLNRIQAMKPGSGTPEFPDDYNLGGMIAGVEIAPPVVRPPEAGVSDNVFFYLPIRIQIGVKIGE
jgi:hypothetical protein